MKKEQIYSIIGTILVVILVLFMFALILAPYQVGEFFDNFLN